MSRILEKAFNAGQKIVRSIFKGSPNLITSSDLNRQIEALKYQIDSVENRVGVLSDMTENHSLSAGTLSVDISYTYMEALGCSFTPDVSSVFSINMTASTGPSYLILTASTQTLTYNSDPTHEIAGARFEDGTSREAANQIVYKDEKISLVHSVPSSGLVAILAVYSLSENKNLIVRLNTVERNTSVMIGNSGGSISDWDSEMTNQEMGVGTTYDKAINILDYRTKILDTKLFASERYSIPEGTSSIIRVYMGSEFKFKNSKTILVSVRVFTSSGLGYAMSVTLMETLPDVLTSGPDGVFLKLHTPILMTIENEAKMGVLELCFLTEDKGGDDHIIIDGYCPGIDKSLVHISPASNRFVKVKYLN